MKKKYRIMLAVVLSVLLIGVNCYGEDIKYIDDDIGLVKYFKKVN